MHALLFALHGAQLFFKQLPHRQIGCNGHKMLCESCRDNSSLSLLGLFFLSLSVTWTGIASGTVQHATLHVSFCGGLVAKHNLHWQVKYYGREKIWAKHIQFFMQHAVTAVPPLDSRTADHNFWVSTASPLSWKRKCVSNPNNSNVVSCLHIDTRRII